MIGRNLTCPFCNRPQVVNSGQSFNSHEHLELVSHRHGTVGLAIAATACSNPDCGEVSLHVYFGKDEHYSSNFSQQSGWIMKARLEAFQLRP